MTTNALPEIWPVSSVHLTEPEVHALDNGLQVYGFNGAANEILKLDLIFDAGRWVETMPLSAAATATMIKSGTDNLSAYEIEAAIDFLGSTIKASAGYNGFTLSLYCMTRHLESGLELLSAILHRNSFPDKELEIYRVNALSRLKINLQKNDYVGDMLFKEMLFGPDHPYGYQTTAERIEAVDRGALMEYYRSNLTAENCYIGLAGNFDRTAIDLLNRFFGQREVWASKGPLPAKAEHPVLPSGELRVVREVKDSVQASIYIGKHSIQRSDPDFHKLGLLNMVYGGYFGSRLMKNIREEKGLTYGIYSYIQQYRHASAFIINTDTAVEYVPQCIDEIYAELDRLIQQPIGKNELIKARNYMMGRLLDQVDGPFKSAGTFLGLKSHNIPLSYVKEKETALKTIGPEDLLETARKYFQKEDLYEVIVK